MSQILWERLARSGGDFEEHVDRVREVPRQDIRRGLMQCFPIGKPALEPHGEDAGGARHGDVFGTVSDVCRIRGGDIEAGERGTERLGIGFLVPRILAADDRAERLLEPESPDLPLDTNAALVTSAAAIPAAAILASASRAPGMRPQASSA